ncbi:LamG-like jellyroll fold domain-containing protein [Vibrio astriarenae]
MLYSKKSLLALSITGALALTGCNSSSNDDSTNPGDTEVKGYTVVMMPDTQKYTRYSPERFDAQTEWIAENYIDQKIVFTAHLGDVVDLPQQDYEWVNARQSLAMLEANPETPYSVVAGNHDVMAYVNGGINNNLDTDRIPEEEPYLDNFHPDRIGEVFDTIKGQDSTGFNTFHKFVGGDREYMVLALDWRPSDETFQWAQDILDANPQTPTIITMHQIMDIGPDGETAVFTDLGAKVWDDLIKNNDQVFMSVNGHHHGEAIKEAKNAYGRDVLMIVMDYQSNFWGGNGMMQLVNFVEEDNKINFRSFSPWVEKIPEEDRERHDQLERWIFDVDFNFDQRFSNLNEDDQHDAPGNIDGVIGYWTFDNDGMVTVTDGQTTFRDLSGNGNVFTLKMAPGTDEEAPVADFFEVTEESADFGYANGSVRLNGGKENGGYFLSSFAPTMMSSNEGMGVLNQYTIEAVVNIDPNSTPGDNGWAGILAHIPSVTDVCKFHEMECSDGDAGAAIKLSTLNEFQWVSVSQDGNDPSDWSWNVDKDYWYHIVITNDGDVTTMYVDNARTMRTGEADQPGLMTIPGAEWAVGISSWDSEYSTPFKGSISEVRISERVLEQDEWLINQ